MSEPSSVLVVGASAAGLATVESLRRGGYSGTVTVVGEEEHAPYDRPPLSKQVLSGSWNPERSRLRTESALVETGAEFVLADPAVRLDPADRTVHTASGRTLRAEAVVLATGLRPKRLPGWDAAGVHVLRTLDDSLRLRAELARARRVVVVGDGVLGSEIAATARGTDSGVTLVGPQAAPMTDQLGPRVAGMLGELHAERGVRLRPRAGVEALEADHGRVTGVRLETGETLPADAVVVAIGAAPATDWLADSGLRLDDGVVCDSRCRAAAGIYAVGDVARWHHEGLDESMRLENRTNATEQAAAVARNLLGADRPYAPVPHFWTDQFDAKIQVHGVPHAESEVTVVEGDPAERRFVVRYTRQGTPVAVLGWNRPKQVRAHRQEVVDTFGVPALEPN
ncbi:Reductase C-terminal [Actinopolyspora lacussalsi subsp. righensis]|uniref:Reductase C-terminal n=1 Tax=Actinopolyspora righensis TaxID=995060 RepID=A0A1I7AHI0_9ACTN|nr:FAD-dependent oxidoreductase [Actinopolyspora righensis]SFT74421.1 Reductase C-terminal [Actinopolyspora righensis]